MSSDHRSNADRGASVRSTPPRLLGLLLLPICLGGAVALATGCSRGGGSGSSSTPPAVTTTTPASSPAGAPTTAATASSNTTASSPSSAGLSGSWSGQYSGAFTGSFRLNWQQRASTLSGTIALSSPPQTLSLNGTVNGSMITFGTVGSSAITYTGTVSGSSMAGTYSVGGSSGGNWSATKSG